MSKAGTVSQWPALALDEWKDTYTTVHRWTQIIGKTCLALAPFQNHWWHSAFQVTACGLRTPTLYRDQRTLEIEFDFLNHNLNARSSDGMTHSVALLPRSVADFFAEYQRMIESMGFAHPIDPVPNELPDEIPFTDDDEHASYDAHAMQRCWRVLCQADRVFKHFRSRFVGKCSPSHFWWGAFDLSCTRFSGRRAPVHPGGVPHLSDRVVREAYSHECISAGWWPGTIGGPVAEASFYAYVYPEPPGCPEARIHPREGHYDTTLHEWVLPYEAVRSARDPDAMLMEFLQSTYEAAADLSGWNRDQLEHTPIS